MRYHPMQLLALLVTAITTVDSAGRPSLMPTQARAAEPTETEVAKPSAPPAKPAPAPQPALSQPVTKRLGASVLYLPAGFSLGGSYDLVVHFHGGSQIMNPQLDGANVALVTVNLGVGSRAYNEGFAAPQALEHLLAAVDRAVAESTPGGKAQRRHLALSSWSAGYGALQQILAHERHVERIDAIFLLDGIHASLAGTSPRSIAPLSMAPFVRFAELAARGDKRMLVTHSAIETYDYASTTESAKYLVRELELGRCDDAPEPGDMRATDCHRRGGLRVLGYAGNDAPAHCQHVRQWKSLVVEPLAAAWSKTDAYALASRGR